MANLFQEMNASFTYEQPQAGGTWYVTMYTPMNQKVVQIMSSHAKLVAQSSADWLGRAAAGQFDDDTIISELIRITKPHFCSAGTALLRVLAQRTGHHYDSAAHTLSKVGVTQQIATSVATHLLFGNAFIKVQLHNQGYGIEMDGRLIISNLRQVEANSLIVTLNQVANDPAARNIDIALWLVRNTEASQFNYEGGSLLQKLCVEAKAKYNPRNHQVEQPGTAPSTMTLSESLDDNWCDDEEDTYGIGKPGAKSTKEWTPDEPDPSVDLLKSIRDICDRSRV